jgi:hypothetical protein
MSRPRLLTFDVAWAIIRQPLLWPESVRTLRRLRPTRIPAGLSRRPLLPTREYLDFRLHTNSGSDDPPSADDVVRFLKWTGSQRKVLG